MILNIVVMFSLATCVYATRAQSGLFLTSSCHSYRSVARTFARCVYEASADNIDNFSNQGMLDQKDAFRVLDYYCSVVDEAARCTLARVSECPNLKEIKKIVKDVGGACNGNSRTADMESLIASDFLYNSSCLRRIPTVIETCASIANIGDDVNLEDGLRMSEMYLGAYIYCTQRTMAASDDPCFNFHDAFQLYIFLSHAFSLVIGSL